MNERIAIKLSLVLAGFIFACHALQDCIYRFTEETVDRRCSACEYQQVLSTHKLADAPEILIIQIIRTVFHNGAAIKPEVPIDVPVDDLDLSQYLEVKEQQGQNENEKEQILQTKQISTNAQISSSASTPLIISIPSNNLQIPSLQYIQYDNKQVNAQVEDKSTLQNIFQQQLLQDQQQSSYHPPSSSSFSISLQQIKISTKNIPSVASDLIPPEEFYPYFAQLIGHNRQVSGARYLLVGFINHRGMSVLSGHYVCYLRHFNRNVATNSFDSQMGQWIECNDSQVPIANGISTEQAYILFYKCAI
ncbi:MAG: hypothetical protein EZS28_020613 [Streblomastix strix]|uniref:USP domain-containing protein n=1 Tax=Streblomastix strix TaxID=222440 RepID=A0A5J4VNG4_9EUKA|nr:MAG: hypothetical protein EZS28_020613 [Streblomastix strix]